MTIPDSALAVLVYAVIGFVLVLFVSFMVAPKRTRKTVNYLLNTFAEFKQAKEHPEEKIEVPDFETRAIPKVPHPRPPKGEV